MTESIEQRTQRRFPRLSVSVKIEGAWWDPDGAKHKLHALLVMVSEGGAQLRTAEPIPANGRIEFWMRLGSLRKFDAHGVVRWWRRNGEVRDLGIEFDEPIRRIGAFVEKELAAAAKTPATGT